MKWLIPGGFINCPVWDLKKVSFFPNGTYVGEFENDKFEAQGIYAFGKGEFEGTRSVGEFKNMSLWNGAEYDNDGNVIATYLEGIEIIVEKLRQLIEAIFDKTKNFTVLVEWLQCNASTYTCGTSSGGNDNLASQTTYCFRWYFSKEFHLRYLLFGWLSSLLSINTQDQYLTQLP